MKQPKLRNLTADQCQSLIAQVDEDEALLGSDAELALRRQVYVKQAEIAANGGKAKFPGLFYLRGRFAGQRAPARLIRARYGWCWAMLDTNWRLTGKFYPTVPIFGPKDDGYLEACNKLADKGFAVRLEDAPAEAYIETQPGNHYIALRRIDKGCPAEALARQVW